MSRFFHLSWMAFFLIPSLIAQEPEQQGYTLSQCVAYALEHSEQIQNAELDNRIAQANVGEIRAVGLPQVNANLALQDNFKVPKVFLPGEVIGGEPGTFVPVEFQPQYAGQANITLTQLLFDGSYFLGLKAASVYTELSRKAIVQTKIELAESIAKAFYGVLVNQERLQLIGQNEARLVQLHQETKALYENGFAEKIDVDRVQVTLNNLRTQKANFQRVLDLSMGLLKFQMGLNLTENIQVVGNLRELTLEAPPLLDPGEAFLQRIEYGILQTQKELDLLNLKNYRVQYFPNLGLSLSYGSNTGTNAFGDLWKFNDQWFGNGSIGLQLNIPIFDGLRKKYQIQGARFALQKTENNLRQLERTTALQVSQSYLSLQNAIQTLEAQRQNMELAQEIYRVANIKYQEGVGANLEVLDAETAYKEAETNYYAALYDALIAKTDLQKAQGTLLNDLTQTTKP